MASAPSHPVPGLGNAAANASGSSLAAHPVTGARTVSAREQLLDVAGRLFDERGVRAVGVDAVIEESGVAKATLYRHFGGKDDLVVACLDRNEQRWWARYESSVERHPDDAGAQLVDFFDQLARRVTRAGWTGCPFLAAGIEYRDAGHPIGRAARDHKARVRRRFAETARAAGFADPPRVADELMIILEGTYMTALLAGPRGAARHAGTLVARLLDVSPRR